MVPRRAPVFQTGQSVNPRSMHRCSIQAGVAAHEPVCALLGISYLRWALDETSCASVMLRCKEARIRICKQQGLVGLGVILARLALSASPTTPFFSRCMLIAFLLTPSFPYHLRQIQPISNEIFYPCISPTITFSNTPSPTSKPAPTVTPPAAASHLPL